MEKFRRVFASGGYSRRGGSPYSDEASLPSSIFLALFFLLLITGCATAPTIAPTVRAQPGLPKPDRVLVHDFDVANADSELNPNQLSAAGTLTEEQIRTGKAAAQVLAVNLIGELKSRGIDAQRASTAAPPEMNTLSIRGRFLWRERDAGSMRARIWFYQGSGVTSRIVAQADADVSSDLKRETAPIGSSAYTATQEADAKRMARELADRVARYYREQGWLPS